jgi:hypothetical protein
MIFVIFMAFMTVMYTARTFMLRPGHTDKPWPNGREFTFVIVFRVLYTVMFLVVLMRLWEVR